MKLRVKDDSFRFRITLKELDLLVREGAIRCQGSFPGPFEENETFSYSVKSAPKIERGTLILERGSITLILSAREVRELKDPAIEGIYLKEEWEDGSGRARRSMAFIEKDRPSSNCDKPDDWIYDDQSLGAAGAMSQADN